MTIEARFVLFVADQVRSTAFYRIVLARQPTFDVPGMTEFALGEGAHLGLMPERGIERLLNGAVRPSEAPGATRAELYLTVADPQGCYERAVAAGARAVSPLAPRDWGDDAAYCVDPDGHVLVFARPSSS